MRILFVTNYGPDQQESMIRFASMLVTAARARGHDVDLFKPPVVFNRLGWLPSEIRKWLGYLDKFIVARPLLRRRCQQADFVHICDHSNAIYTMDIAHIPHLVTCHDMTAVRSALGELQEHATRFTGRLFQRWILKGLRRAAHVACVSRATRKDVIRLTGLSECSVTVVYNSLNFEYYPSGPGEIQEAMRQAGLPDDIPYLLHVGGNQWYKNRTGVLRIFKALVRSGAALDIELLLVGKPLTAELQGMIDEPDLSGRVRVVSGIGNEVLRALYSGARGLLFPSLYEGFGWPIIEAQACGCPVFVTGRAPMNEVAGDAAIYIDPERPEKAAQRILDGLTAREQLVKAGFHNVERFAQGRMVEQYLSLYDEILAKN